MPNLTDLAGYKAAYNSAFEGRQGVYAPHVTQGLTNIGTSFQSQFRQLVGRDPNEDEINKFFTEAVAPNAYDLVRRDTETAQRAGIFDTTQQFIGGNFQQAAEEQALSQLEAQKAENARLADLFEQQGQQAIGGVESSLMDFTQRLMERVRPNLITSLQAQGLLNTGGLNQAIAGQQADLSRDAAAQVADLTFQNQQAANQIRFGGESAPLAFQQQQTANMLPNLQSSSQNAIQRLFSDRQQQQQFQNQAALMQLQATLNAPGGGFFKQVGNTLAPSLGTSLGNSLGQWASPTTWGFGTKPKPAGSLG